MQFLKSRKYLILKKVIVNLKTGTVFSGVISLRSGDLTILKGARILQDRGRKIEKTEVDGEVVVQNIDIDFVQVL